MRIVTIALVALALVGCNRRPSGPCMLGGRGAVTSARTYWVTSLEVPLGDRMPIAGLNLDGFVTEGRSDPPCRERANDATSSLGDGEGIDNALARFAPTIEMNWSPAGTFAEEIDGAIEAGGLPLAIVLEDDGADTCGNPTTTIILRAVERTDGMPIVIGADHMPVDGQPLALGAVLADGRGTTLEGRFHAELVGDRTVPLDRDLVRAPIGALSTMEPEAIALEVEGDELVRVAVGGSWESEALVPEVAAGIAVMGAESLARTLLGEVADLPPADGVGACTRVSAGLELRARELAIPE